MVETQYIINELLPSYKKIISQQLDVESIILYGSYAKDSANEISDIDLAVVLNNGTTSERFSILKYLNKIALSLDPRIEPRCFFKQEIESAEPASILSEIIKTGLIIN